MRPPLLIQVVELSLAYDSAIVMLLITSLSLGCDGCAGAAAGNRGIGEGVQHLF